MSQDNCPCCSGLRYSECCQPVIEGKQIASTAEALMRSRYTAYYLQNAKYLLQSWHSSTRPGNIDFTDTPDWLGLQIVRSEQGQAEDNSSKVEFIAHFASHGKQASLHETSSFTKEQGHWLYVDGQIHTRNPSQNPAQIPELTREPGTPGTGKISRNAPCPCGSGKKYKRCCLAK